MNNNISNRNGRALEYIITKEIIRNHPGATLTSRAITDQHRDISKFNQLSNSQQAHYLSSASKIVNWLSSSYNITNTKITVDRLPHTAARGGNPTDINIMFNNGQVNLSIKHNHRAVKHQRPSALAQQCGFIKNSKLDKLYRSKLKQICNNFSINADLLIPKVTKFNEIKQLKPNFIGNNLYRPICNEVVNFLNHHCKNNYANRYFKFIVGTTNFIKIIVYEDRIDIYDFSSIPPPSSLYSTRVNDSHIEVCFSNKWIIDMRLHTASSRMDGCEKNVCSLKFDTQSIHDTVPKIQL